MRGYHHACGRESRWAILALGFLVLSLSAAAQPTGYWDEFTARTLNSAWRWIREDSSGWKLTGSCLELATQRGTLQGIPADHPGTNNARNLLLTRIYPRSSPGTGYFQMSIRFCIHPKEEGQCAGLIYYFDDDNYISFSRGIFGKINGLLIQWEIQGMTRVRAEEQPTMDSLTITLINEGNGRFSYWISSYRYSSGWFQTDIPFPPSDPKTVPQFLGLFASGGTNDSADVHEVRARFYSFSYGVIPNSVEDGGIPLSEFSLSELYPNPLFCSGSGPAAVNVNISLPERRNLECRVVDVLGRTILAETEELNRGVHPVRIALPPLAPGSYILQIRSCNMLRAKSFLVM